LAQRLGVTQSMVNQRDKRCYTCAEAMTYLGLKRRAFEKHIRPRLPSPMPCGTTRVFEGADLDRAWEEYCAAQRSRQAVNARANKTF
ncbi:MAG: hypothetical protein ABWY12_05145, partial [Burkholderiales bacterium]